MNKTNYYKEIKNKLIDNEVYSKVKDYSKERHKVITYFEIGRLLNEAGGKYGDNIIGEFSNKLVIEVGKTYSERTLRRMRQFYVMFNNKKWSPLVTKLTWSHYIILMSLKNEKQIDYYLGLCMTKPLTKRELEYKIKSNEYERLPEATINKLVFKEKLEIKDLVPNPIIIKNKSDYEIASEKTLQKLILEDIESFMKELGASFCFISSQYKIKTENSYNYIDLLLYNIKFKCYVVIELKITVLKKEHIGQIQTYMNYIDRNIKTIEENKTIGIIICKRDNKFVMEYCSDVRIISREYEILSIV